MAVSQDTFRSGTAALLAGWEGPEGLRSQLKAGLLPERSENGTWRDFTFADVCALRLFKVLISRVDAPLAREIVNAPQVRGEFYLSQSAEDGLFGPGFEMGEPRFIVVALTPQKNQPNMAILKAEDVVRVIRGEWVMRSEGHFVISLEEVRRFVRDKIG